MKRREEEKKGKRREVEWEILGGGLRDFVVVGKVVLYSLIVIQFFSFFLIIFIFHSCFKNPSPPSLPLQFDHQAEFPHPFLPPSHYINYHPPITIITIHYTTSVLISSFNHPIHPFYANAPKYDTNPTPSPLFIFFYIFFFSPTRRGTKGSTISYDRASSKNRRFS